MRAIDKLKELYEKDNQIVAIAKDENGEIYYYSGLVPTTGEKSDSWGNGLHLGEGMFLIEQDIEFDSQDWKECIVTINDLENLKSIQMNVKQNSKLSAFPVVPSDTNCSITQYGLTKREHFASLAMQGLLINYVQNLQYGSNIGYPEVSAIAVRIADELLKQLSNESN